MSLYVIYNATTGVRVRSTTDPAQVPREATMRAANLWFGAFEEHETKGDWDPQLKRFVVREQPKIAVSDFLQIVTEQEWIAYSIIAEQNRAAAYRIEVLKSGLAFTQDDGAIQFLLEDMNQQQVIDDPRRTEIINQIAAFIAQRPA